MQCLVMSTNPLSSWQRFYQSWSSSFVSVLASWYQASPPTGANIRCHVHKIASWRSMLCPAHSCFLISIDITYLSLRRSDQSLLVPPPSIIIMFPATLTWHEQDQRSTSASASNAYADHCLWRCSWPSFSATGRYSLATSFVRQDELTCSLSSSAGRVRPK